MAIASVSLSLTELADKCGLELRANDVPVDQQVTGASSLEESAPGLVTFLDNPKYVKYLSDTRATAVICQEKHYDAIPSNVAALISPRPYDSYAQAMAVLYPTYMRPMPVTGEAGISAKAFVSDACEIEDNVTIEAGACIGKGASIGSGSVILPNAVVGEGVTIGRNTTIGSNATVIHSVIGDGVIIHGGAQIGQDGFGFAMGPGGHRKIPQFGRVIIQDRVEIGAGTAIDRGANRDTIIGEGTKIDNQVQIGHNVVMGRNCVIVGQVGIAGSATLGDFVVVAGKSGIAGHVKVGDGAQIGGGTGVFNDVEPGESVMGVPAIQASTWMRQAAKITIADRKAKAAKKKGNKDG